MNNPKFVIIFTIIALVVGGIFYLAYPTPNDYEAPGGENQEEPEAVFCTADAKLCPDGSYVGRIPPTCEFAACPGSTSTDTTPPSAGSPNQNQNPEQPVACTMEAKLCPDGSYVGRQGPNCEFAPCPGQ